MSPEGQGLGGKPVASDNLYTVILAIAFFVLFITTAFVAYKCYSQYGTIFGIP